VFVHSPLVESRCPCRDVGEAILVGSLRPIRTARETLGGRTLERPSCGGFMPTAETTLFPAYSARSRRLLTSSVRLDNEPNLPNDVRFSNRPVRVKRFQAIHGSGVDVARGLVLLYGIGT